jgi:hypothetical protein
MSQPIDTNDPRLTAYVLGEMQGSERAEFEMLLKQNPEAQKLVDEIRHTASFLTEQFSNEPCPQLSEEDRREIISEADKAGKIIGFPWRRYYAPLSLSAIAACLLVALGWHFMFINEKVITETDSTLEQREKISKMNSSPASPATGAVQPAQEKDFRDEKRLDQVQNGSSLAVGDDGVAQKQKIVTSKQIDANIPKNANSISSSTPGRGLSDAKAPYKNDNELRRSSVTFGEAKTATLSSADESKETRESAPAAASPASRLESEKTGSALIAGAGVGSSKPSSEPEDIVPNARARSKSELKKEVTTQDELSEGATAVGGKVPETLKDENNSVAKGDFDKEIELSIDDAYQQLLKAQAFSIGPVGESNQISQAEQAYRRILRDPQAIALFKKAFEEGRNPAVKIYALCGLRQLDEKSYGDDSKILSESNPTISRIKGSVVWTEPAANLLQEIEKKNVR